MDTTLTASDIDYPEFDGYDAAGQGNVFGFALLTPASCNSAMKIIYHVFFLNCKHGEKV